MFFVLEVKVNIVTHDAATNRIGDFLNDKEQHAVFTPNPEMIVKAQKDCYFKEVLNKGNLNLCDGFGLWLAMKLKIKKEKRKDMSERIAGVDFMVDVCRIAEEREKSVYLLGSGSDEVVNKTAKNMRKQFPKLKIVGLDKGPALKENVELRMKNEESINNETMKPRGERDFAVAQQLNKETGLIVDKQENDQIINQINQSGAEIIFVAFGMGKQEKWIHENLAKMPSVKIAMGVGGAFDYISGAIPRAPLLMRKFGLEWVYRLLRQPRRVGRIFNATVKFIFCYLWKKRLHSPRNGNLRD